MRKLRGKVRNKKTGQRPEDSTDFHAQHAYGISTKLKGAQPSSIACKRMAVHVCTTPYDKKQVMKVIITLIVVAVLVILLTSAIWKNRRL